MPLSPLQSRLAASLAASLLVIALYLMLRSPTLAMAAELGLPSGPLLDIDGVHADLEHSSRGGAGDGLLQDLYEPEFGLFDRSIIGRAAPDTIPLDNNAPKAYNLKPGAKACYVFKSGGSSKRKQVERAANNAVEDMVRTEDLGDGGFANSSLIMGRDDSATEIYIAASTCLQPTVEDSTPPQLTLYITNSTDIGCPGPGLDDAKQQVFPFDQGAARSTLNATGDIYVSVQAPNVTGDHDGMWNFEIAASVDEYYYKYAADAPSQLLWMDSDSSAALLQTMNLTETESEISRIMNETLPYELFVHNVNASAIQGVEKSVCGLSKNAQISVTREGNGKQNYLVKTEMTTRGPGGFPKQQFYFEGLNQSSSYVGVLVKAPEDSDNIVNSKRQEGTAGGGGMVFPPTTFETTPESSCRVVTDLEFCNEIQYAVPGNDAKFNSTALAKAYDDHAKKMYENFQKVITQVQCHAESTSRYSLVRGCDDCEAAYKKWLCTVSLPRCEDFSSDSEYLAARNVGHPFPNGTFLPDAVTQQELADHPHSNYSRNSFVDEQIGPGPYKELLPCADICYEVVQSCPAAIGFTCPSSGRPGFKYSYGQRDENELTVTCNYPGEARTPISAARAVRPSVVAVSGVVVLVMALLSAV